jgi:hypothetical protein
MEELIREALGFTQRNLENSLYSVKGVKRVSVKEVGIGLVSVHVRLSWWRYLIPGMAKKKFIELSNEINKMRPFNVGCTLNQTQLN